MYIHNAHNAPGVLNSLESFLGEKPNPEGFRLWVACQADPDIIPVRLLQNSIKAVVDSPKVSNRTAPGYRDRERERERERERKRERFSYSL